MKRPRLHLHDNTGYTLTELMVVTSMIVIMSSVGYSGFTSFNNREKVRSAAYQFVSHLKESRMKAIEKACSHTIGFDNTFTRYTIFMDTNSDYTQQATEAVVRQVNLETGITVTVTPATGFPLQYVVQGLPRCQGVGCFDVNGMITVRFARPGFSVSVVVRTLGSFTLNEGT